MNHRLKAVVRAVTLGLALVSAPLALSGCALFHQAPPPPPPAPPPAPLPPPPPPPTEGGLESVQPQRNAIIGTQLVGPEADLGPIPTLTLILKSGDTARNASVCQGFSALPTAAAAQASNPNGIVIPFRWLMVRTPTTSRPDCDSINADYDFFRAGSLLGALAGTTVTEKGKSADFSGRGPFLLEQFSDANGLHYLLVDFSKAGEADFQRLGAMVQTAIARQADALTSNGKLLAAPPGGAADDASDAAKSKSGAPGWIHKACGVAKSPIVKILQIILVAVFPPALVVTTPMEAVANAGCAGKS